MIPDGKFVTGHLEAYMRKRDTAMLVGGTLTGMGIVMNCLALEEIRRNFLRKSPKIVKAGQIESVDEMHLDYLRRKGKKWIKSQKRETLEIVSRDGYLLQGEYIHNISADRSGGKPTDVVILSHGYGGTGYNDLLIFADFYGRAGFDILLIDQRAHGKSEGNMITFGAREQDDMTRWIRAAIEIAGDDSRILLHGWSMGAAIVYLAAANGLPSQVKGIVYDCGYNAAEAEFFHIAKQTMPLPPAILYYIIKFMNPWCRVIGGFDMKESSPILAAKNMRLPILFVHGEGDDIVPAWMGKQLCRATTKTRYRDFLLVKGADHTYSYLHDKAEYEKRILKLWKACTK